MEVTELKVVLKIGGSLMNYPIELSTLLKTIEGHANHHRILLVPGGGQFADAVLRIQESLSFSDDTAHWMAIMAQDQFGAVLIDLLSSKYTKADINEFTNSNAAGLFVLLPFSYIREADDLPHTWDVTSDSIALWVGKKTGSEIVILVKSVDGILDPSNETQILSRVEAKKLHLIDSRNIVDTYLPQLFPKFGGRLFVVNGRQSERLSHLFTNQDTICTEII
jgi:aspartokinase-like uncharacterized kinase